MILLLMACAGVGDPIGGGGDWADYVAIREDDSRVFRDDGAEDEPDPTRLLHARVVGDTTFELRRGERWADGQTVGEIVWDLSDGLVLSRFALDELSVQGPLRLLNADSEVGELVPSADYQCVVGIPGELETWYGSFIDTLTLDCSGAGLGGQWAFARDFGLVRFDGPLTLDLVAPW